jgi:hypothetical protein
VTKGHSLSSSARRYLTAISPSPEFRSHD